ncbi:MAG: hypothetical protein IPP42_04675 [Saprospiraceae bacterium]|nr:hypothetical protein [Saprospiraceae bacterium]
MDHTKLQNRMRKGSEEEPSKQRSCLITNPVWMRQNRETAHTALAALPEQDREVLILPGFQRWNI